MSSEENIKNDREHYAYDDAGHDREIERHAFPFEDNISG
jgi:hypothetical protein